MELKFESVTKNYGKHCALKDFSLTMTDGVYAILGPNGAGKTTLMNCVTGSIRQTSGSIFFNGEDVRKMKSSFRAKLGYLPQSFGFYPTFTVIQVLRYFAKLKNVKDPESVIERSLKTVNLTEEANVKVKGLSGGMLRRLGIAAALLGDPEVLILDEPTAGLDPKERIRFRNLISEVGFQRIVVLATHIVSDVEAIAKNVVLLRNGTILSASEPEPLISSMNGKVWNTLQPNADEAMLNNSFKISNVTKSGTGVTLKIVSDEKPYDNAQPAEPTLEDVYLYYFDEAADENG